MPSIRWTLSIATGHPEIDNDHRVLIDLINRLLELNRDGHAMDELNPVVEELERYTRFHFAREEQLMETVEYPDAAAHKEEHRMMRLDVQLLAEDVRAGKASVPRISQFVTRWLIRHIGGFDTGLGRALARRPGAAAR